MFKLNKKGDFEYYTIPSFEETGLVRHGFTTRRGGVSGGCYESMNLRFNCDDSRENVLENFRRAAEGLGMSYERLVLSKQVHEDRIITINESHCGNGVVRENEFSSADALITDRKNIPLVTLFADCVPLFFLDKRQGVIALAHSGWRGTVKRIGQKTVRKMKDAYGSCAEDIIAAIGPSIQSCCFEVGDDVAEIFIDKFGEETAKRHGERYHVDMQRAICIQLAEEGVTAVDNSGICTCCNSDFLFSHRKTNGRRGNMGAFMMLV